jgi:hypothetical protein
MFHSAENIMNRRFVVSLQLFHLPLSNGVLTRLITRNGGQSDGDVSKPISQRKDRVYPKPRSAPALQQVLLIHKRKLHHITDRGS